MVYLTGDTHGDFNRIKRFCEQQNTTVDDILIILGDAGINYYGDWNDVAIKRYVSELPITLFCIHGNHERRPHTIHTYTEREFHGGTVWIEEKYPNILFAKDGETFDFEGKKCIVIGGAYSVDKHYRLAKGWYWFPDEQPSEEIKRRVEDKLLSVGYKIDIVLSHTCPLKYEPVECFLSGVDQSKVDKSTEKWLDTIETMLVYEKWYCGHYHIAKSIDKVRFMFEDYDTLTSGRM